jgi:hypothetical protein
MRKVAEKVWQWWDGVRHGSEWWSAGFEMGYEEAGRDVWRAWEAGKQVGWEQGYRVGWDEAGQGQGAERQASEREESE